MEETPTSQRRVWLVTIVVALSFVGFSLGSRPRVSETQAALSAPKTSSTAAAPARTNAELVASPWRHSTSLALTGNRPPPAPLPGERQNALEKRKERRAFSSAPPTIPHPVSQNSGTECRSCHEHGAVIGTRVAPQMSHPLMTMCTQCHVPETSIFATADSAAATVASDFEALETGAPTYQYGPETPPQVPHSKWMRQECASCHGPLGHPGLQTAHPDRQSCEQCHTSSAGTNQASNRE